MSTPAVTTDAELRVLVLAPTPKDFELTRSTLGRHGVAVEACPSVASLCPTLDAGAGAVLLAEEALPQTGPLMHWIEGQQTWSDLPVLVLSRPDTDASELAIATRGLGNVTILVRPIRIAALVSAVQSALRARRRQYQIRQYLAELAATEERLRANDQRKDEFLAILAHELRNPLAPVSNALHVLRPRLAGDKHSAALGQMMERQVRNLTRLVNDLLEVSRVTRGELDLHRERTELAQVVRTALESSQHLLDQAEHQLVLHLPSAPVHLHADPVRVAQIVANLLNNAAKYTPPGGRIGLSARSEAGQVVIEVEDDGMGIPPAEQARIFELFMQVDEDRHRAQGGLGIGLTLVKRLAELHGGTVSVFSEGRGKGSRFTVRLPALGAPELAPSQRGSDARPDLSAVRVLIADDNRDAADSLGLLLEQFGAEVTVAHGGRAALKALDLRRMNAAIIDIGMPEIGGLELARRIRAQEGSRALLLLALTGWGQQRDILETRKAGFDYHLTKPVDVAVLVERLLQVSAPG